MSSAKELLKIINEVLEISKLSAAEITLKESPYDLKKYLEFKISVLQQLIVREQKAVEVILMYPEEVTDVIVADEYRVGRAVNNVITNAVKLHRVGLCKNRGRNSE